MRMILISLFFSGLAVVSCSDDLPDQNVALSRQLEGQWRNVSLRIDMSTYKNSDSSQVLEVTEANWEEKMKIQPIRTFFNENGTYNSEHIALDGHMVYNPSGNWMIIGDTLIMTDTFPERGLSYRYRLTIRDSLAEFRGVEDCDQDGAADDQYYGLQRRYGSASH